MVKLQNVRKEIIDLQSDIKTMPKVVKGEWVVWLSYRNKGYYSGEGKIYNHFGVFRNWRFDDFNKDFECFWGFLMIFSVFEKF